MFRLVLVVCFLVLGCKPLANSLPTKFSAKVIKVRDGDTVEVLYKKEVVVIRLAHIDCPERKQPYNKRAKKFTSDFCFGKKVKILSNGKYDRYRRLIAEVAYKKELLNKQLVANGYALHYKKYSKDTVYARLEKEARAAKRGMWAQENLIAPWVFRKRKK